jgi:protein tyrosine phosphatase (PTP) superfamily phosphohydrolase (DUF442 family)
MPNVAEPFVVEMKPSPALRSARMAQWAKPSPQFLTLAAVVLGVVCSFAVWNNLLKDQFVIRRFGVVEDGRIYRSGRLTESTLSKLHRSHPVRTIVDLGGYEPGSGADRIEAEFAKRNGIDRQVFRLYGDGTGNPQAYVDALRLMNDPAQQPVLVHCAAGTERTGTAVMLQRMIFEGRSIEDAYAEAQQCGHNADKNDRMLQYVKRWRGAIEMAVRTGEDIPGMPAPCADRADTADSVPGTR